MDPHPLGGVRHVSRFEFCRQLALPFVSTVLEPDLDLGLGEAERRGQSRPLGTRQVALQVEDRLQLEHLIPREHGPRLLLPPFHVIHDGRRTSGCSISSDVMITDIVVVVIVVVIVVVEPTESGYVLWAMETPRPPSYPDCTDPSLRAP